MRELVLGSPIACSGFKARKAWNPLRVGFSLVLLVVAIACGGGAGSGGEVVPPATAAPVISSFRALSATVKVGEQPELIATFENGVGSVDRGVGSVRSGVGFKAPLVATPGPLTYTLTVMGPSGVSVAKSVVVDVLPATDNGGVVVSASNNGNVTVGRAATLVPIFPAGTGVIDQGIGPVTSGVPVVVTPSQPTTVYTLTVTLPSGAVLSSSTTVTTVAPPTITSFTVN